jgi:hypothetical protein
MIVEKRRYQRVAIEGLRVVITDGTAFYSAEISNASQDGLQLSHLPNCFDDKSKVVKVMVFGEGCRFKMIVQPRWSYFCGNDKKIGFKIHAIPWEWTEFIMGTLAGASYDTFESPTIH